MRDFNGIKAPWVAQLNMASGGAVSEMESYAPPTIARNSAIGWNKGTTALLLDDAEGNTWIMKGFQLGVNPQYTFEQFVAAGATNRRYTWCQSGVRATGVDSDQQPPERPAGDIDPV